MGGFGSGRGQRGKDTTSDMRPLDIRKLQRDGLLTPGRAFGWHWKRNGEEVASIQMRTEVDRVILNYRSRSNGGEWQAMEYPVRLEWTGCNLGGRRAWFLCPAQGCGRRVAILFGGSIFACRHCHKLAYQCQRETDDDRAMRRADTIRRRLGWEAGIANPEGGKPKGMRWRTFERLKAEHDAFANASWAGMAERLGLMNRRLAGLGLEPLDDQAGMGKSVSQNSESQSGLGGLNLWGSPVPRPHPISRVENFPHLNSNQNGLDASGGAGGTAAEGETFGVVQSVAR